MQYIKQKLKIFLPLLFILSMLGGQAIIPAGAYACGSSTGSSTSQVINGASPDGTDCSGTGIIKIVRAAVSVLSIIIGAAAVLMIVVSGLRYITSSGDSAKVSAAKNTLIYALIGVAIAALAQLLVHFALNQSNNAINPPTPAPTTVKKP
jgi:ABC-type Fe3+ transport system permease subunit